MQRDVHHDAGGGQRPGHAGAGETQASHHVAAELERRQQLVDRLRDPARDEHGA
jgi:hypothetical protein